MISQSNNLLAIEWDRHEARYVWASTAGRRVLVRAIGRIAAAEGDGAAVLQTMLADIKSLLRIKNPRVEISLARSECEEAEAILPPADEHEIAQFVVNQAHERWPAISDHSIIDYYALEDDIDAMSRVSIVLLPTEKKKVIEGTFKKVGWRPASLQLRHLGAVNLFRRQVDLSQLRQCVLLSLSPSEAELIVFSNEHITLVRTIALSSSFDPGLLAEKLTVEIQRSLMVTANPNLGASDPSHSIFLFGDPIEEETMAEQLGKALQMQVTVLDPLRGIARATKESPAQIHQFASLLGSIFEQPKRQTVDFMNPKCAKSFPLVYQRLVLYAGAIACVLGLLIWSGLNEVSDLRKKNAALKTELNAASKKIDNLKRNTAIVDYVDNWRIDDINWLDELRELTLQFPERSQAQVKSMSMSIGPNGKGLTSMNLRAKDDLVISRLEQSIRDEHHTVRTNKLSQSATDEEYPWQFVASVLVNRRERDEFILEPAREPILGNSLPISQVPENSPLVIDGASHASETTPGIR